MGVPARKYIPLAESLNEQGMISALFELRGIDSSSVRASKENNFGYHEILNIDLPEAISFIKAQYPENPVYLLGHSLGGQLAMLYMSINPQQITGLIGVATGTPLYRGWRFPYNLGIWFMSKALPLIAKIVGHFPGRKFGFGGREGKQLVKDWAHSVVTGNYLAAGFYDQDNKPFHFESKIQALAKQALLITIDKDTLAPQASIKNLGDKLARSDVTYHHLEGDDFNFDSLGHFNWMKEPAPIVKKIKHWIN